MDTGEQNKKKIDWSRGDFPTWVKMLVAVAVVLLMMLVLFRVKTFEVQGNVRYSIEEVAQASGITEGDFLMGVNKTSTASRLLVKLPYLKSVTIYKSLPGTVRFEVEECEAAVIGVSEFATYWVMNGEGKLLEEIEEPEGDLPYPVIEGTLLTLPAGGDMASFDDDARGKLSMELVSSVADTSLVSAISKISVEDPSDVYLVYEDRIEIHIGDGDDAEYKLQYFKAVLSQLAQDASGVMDLSFSKGEQAVFHPLIS